MRRILKRPAVQSLIGYARVPLRRIMLALARQHRARLRGVRFIGITGSCGKTSTKELLHHVLGGTHAGVVNKLSQNGYYSVFSTVMKTRRLHAYCLQEIATGGPGTLDQILPLVQPDIGVVLNIGTDHYKAFRGQEAVAKEKGRLIEVLPADGVAVLNADDPFVRAMAERTRARIVWFGQAPDAEVRAEQVACGWPHGLRFTAVVGTERAEVRVPLYSACFVPNVLAALAVARCMGLSLADAARRMETPTPTQGRLEARAMPDGVVFLGDYWKASMTSFPPALEALRGAEARRRIAVIGTLSDYAGSASQQYRNIARELLGMADIVLFVGPQAERALKAAREFPDKTLRAFATARDVDAHLSSILQPGDVVLVKGSGKVDHLERLLYNRERPIGCWRHQCGRKLNCNQCPLLYKPQRA